MRKKSVDGVIYECPMYLVRAGDGWQIRLPGEASKYFADNLCGGARGAFDAAVDALAEKLPITNRIRPLADRDRSGKDRSTGLPDVFLLEEARDTQAAEGQLLRVQIAERSAGMTDVGAATPWKRRLESKIERASQAWEQMVKQVQEGVDRSRRPRTRRCVDGKTVR